MMIGERKCVQAHFLSIFSSYVRDTTSSPPTLTHIASCRKPFLKSCFLLIENRVQCMFMLLYMPFAKGGK